jgi:hypothetical protein
MKALLLKRAYDACAVTDASVTIFINKVNLASRNSPTTPNSS